MEGSHTQTVSRWLAIRDRRQLAGRDIAGVRERLAGDGLCDCPQFGEVVLDPAGLREVLANSRYARPIGSNCSS